MWWIVCMTDTIARLLQENVILCMNNTVRIITLMVSWSSHNWSVLLTCAWSSLFSWFGLVRSGKKVNGALFLEASYRTLQNQWRLQIVWYRICYEVKCCWFPTSQSVTEMAFAFPISASFSLEIASYVSTGLLLWIPTFSAQDGALALHVYNFHITQPFSLR